MPMLKSFLKDIPYYLQLMRIDKPIGTLLLLWPTLCAVWIASDGNPNAVYVWVFTLGVLVMRSAGCVINDYADRDVDPLVERTKQRPLAAGRLQARQALVLFAVLGAIAIGLLLILPARVWPWSIPAVIVTIIYPYMKRVIEAPQLVLGIAFSFGIPMVFVTFDHAFDHTFWLLFLSNFLWVLVYDTQYAMSDREDDLKIGVKSTAILFANADKRMIALFQILVLLFWGILTQYLKLHATMWLTLLMVAALFVYQQWLIKDRQRLPCFQAFLNNGWVGAFVWFGLVSAY